MPSAQPSNGLQSGGGVPDVSSTNADTAASVAAAGQGFGPSGGGGGGGGGVGLLAQMDSNPFFTGGLGLAAMGVAAGVLRSAMGVGTVLLRRHLMMTLEVTNKDPSFPWVMNWLTTQGRRSQHLSVSTRLVQEADGAKGLRFDMVPGPGKHLIPFRNKWFWVDRERQVTSVTLESGAPFEKLVLTTLGRDPSVFDVLLRASRDLALQKDAADTLRIYTAWGADWKVFGHPRKKRILSSVVLDDGVAEELLDDLQEWRGSSSWYHERGVPYRRGYLLHGPPGSGKTSFIYALAGSLDYDICVLSLSEDGMSDDRLAHSLSTAPQRSIILLEDVDAAFVSRGASGDSRSRVTFSGLLNTLDGVASSEERIIFMTTNFVERLDPALLRPGRVDVSMHLGDATESQVRRLFLQFYPPSKEEQQAGEGTEEEDGAGEKEEEGQQQQEEEVVVEDEKWSGEERLLLAEEFARAFDAQETRPSMAALQGYLLRFKTHPKKAVAGAKAFAAIEASERRLRDSHAAHREATTAGAEGRKGGHVAGEDGGGGKGKRRITAYELDKMMFNPQPGSGFEKP